MSFINIIDAFYSDPHFGHKNIIKYANRPVNSLENMHKNLISLYNCMIDEDDVCLWLGDAFFCCQDEATAILSAMNGKKLIVRGNHDKSANWLLNAGFDMVFDNWISMKIGDVPVRCCHYPYRYGYDRHSSEIQNLYPTKRKGEILIHGHTHLREILHGNQIHVGVDATGYMPLRTNEVWSLIKKCRIAK